MTSTVVVTGAAGFIGHHTARLLAQTGTRVIGVDNLDDYYDVHLKRMRIARLEELPDFTFRRLDVADAEGVERLLGQPEVDRVIHLAARPGVRASALRPRACIRSNVMGFVNVLESARRNGIGHVVYASSSSVYGASARLPYSEHDHGTGHPMSLYGASKRANELMAHSYAHLYGMPVTGLRFFSVYGPWGRPDMAYYRFADAIRTQDPIVVFGDGSAIRDFTYVDDIVGAIVQLLDRPAKPAEGWWPHDPDPATSADPYRIYNIGHGSPITVRRLIELLESAMGMETAHEFGPPRPGDVAATEADTSVLAKELGLGDTVPPEVGIQRFVDWYMDYHAVVRA